MSYNISRYLSLAIFSGAAGIRLNASESAILPTLPQKNVEVGKQGKRMSKAYKCF
jgi:hypothetical protein